MPTEELGRFEMLASSDWLQAVDHWRAKQDDIPSRDKGYSSLGWV